MNALACSSFEERKRARKDRLVAEHHPRLAVQTSVANCDGGLSSSSTCLPRASTPFLTSALQHRNTATTRAEPSLLKLCRAQAVSTKSTTAPAVSTKSSPQSLFLTYNSPRPKRVLYHSLQFFLGVGLEVEFCFFPFVLDVGRVRMLSTVYGMRVCSTTT